MPPHLPYVDEYADYPAWGTPSPALPAERMFLNTVRGEALDLLRRWASPYAASDAQRRAAFLIQDLPCVEQHYLIEEYDTKGRPSYVVVLTNADTLKEMNMSPHSGAMLTVTRTDDGLKATLEYFVYDPHDPYAHATEDLTPRVADILDAAYAAAVKAAVEDQSLSLR